MIIVLFYMAFRFQNCPCVFGKHIFSTVWENLCSPCEQTKEPILSYFKMLVLSFKSLYVLESGYLQDCLFPYSTAHRLQSSEKVLLRVPSSVERGGHKEYGLLCGGTSSMEYLPSPLTNSSFISAILFLSTQK